MRATVGGSRRLRVTFYDIERSYNQGCGV